MKDHHECLPGKAKLGEKVDDVDQEEVKRRVGMLEKLKAFEYLVMDATRLDFRDNSFDIVIDKGTYDALACGTVEGAEDQK